MSLSSFALVVSSLVFGMGVPALAEQRFATTVWTCELEGTEEAFARLDVTFSAAWLEGDHVSPLARSGVFGCGLPWGNLRIEVIGYNSPGDVGQCGLVESWGLSVSSAESTLFESPAESARSCGQATFNPFVGWVQADRERLTICRTTSRESDAYSCETVMSHDL